MDLIKHDMPMVKRACAGVIGTMAKLIPKEMHEKIFPLFEILIKDRRNSVKIKAIESSISLLEIFKEQGLINQFLELIKKADQRKLDWRVRYALAETLA